MKIGNKVIIVTDRKLLGSHQPGRGPGIIREIFQADGTITSLMVQIDGHHGPVYTVFEHEVEFFDENSSQIEILDKYENIGERYEY
tara:strand:- start:628 stop:885 length:258 start_codon:yes stop_codon:yes gene_type:complete